MKRMMIALGTAATLAMAGTVAGTAIAAAQDTAAPAAGMTPTTAADYVAMAGASDLYEMQSSQLALQKSQKADVRSFAQMMISDHTKTTQQVTAAARAAGLNPPPPQLMPMQSDMIAQLQSASASDFDRTYLTQQVQAHQMALQLHQNYAAKGDTAALRTAAKGAVPIVRHHYDRVRKLAGSS